MEHINVQWDNKKNRWNMIKDNSQMIIGSGNVSKVSLSENADGQQFINMHMASGINVKLIVYEGDKAK